MQYIVPTLSVIKCMYFPKYKAILLKYSFSDEFPSSQSQHLTSFTQCPY